MWKGNAKAFDIKDNQVVHYELPRLFTKDKEIKSNYKILYAPTFRDDNSIDCDWDYLNSELKKRNIIIDVKLHPFDKTFSKKLEFLTSFNIVKTLDIYEIIHDYDLLISDYSSIFIDAIYLNVPVVLYAFDFYEYISKSRELYVDFDLIESALSVARSPSELINIIDSQEFKDGNILRKYFWGEESLKDCNSMLFELVYGVKYKNES